MIWYAFSHCNAVFYFNDVTMTLSEFKKSIQQSAPPSNLSILLQALWFDAKGNWDKAHQLAQEVETSEGSWIHAYLHRKEGDLGNAGYWYHRAKQPVCNKLFPMNGKKSQPRCFVKLLVCLMVSGLNSSFFPSF